MSLFGVRVFFVISAIPDHVAAASGRLAYRNGVVEALLPSGAR
jgi:hypothetical protein